MSEKRTDSRLADARSPFLQHGAAQPVRATDVEAAALVNRQVPFHEVSRRNAVAIREQEQPLLACPAHGLVEDPRLATPAIILPHVLECDPLPLDLHRQGRQELGGAVRRAVVRDHEAEVPRGLT